MRHRIYFDYAATAPLDPRVLRAMRPYFADHFGNPGSLHMFGQQASAAVFAARRAIARAIGAHYAEIIFTGSATEANNLILRGAVRAARAAGFPGRGRRPRLIVSSIEHESVLETARELENEGAEVMLLPVSREGIVSLAALRGALNGATALVSVMYANNEVGTIQPIAEIARIIGDFKKSKSGSPSARQSGYPLFHTDAAQAFQYLDCSVEAFSADAMTLSAHKIYGPKGIGLLFVRRHAAGGYPVTPIVTGGGQEFGMRSGTENVPSIVGFGAAVEFACAMREKERERLRTLQEHMFSFMRKELPRATLNGSAAERLPNNINLHLPGVRTDELLMRLDRAGFAASAGPACAARAFAPSHVLAAMGFSLARRRSSIRLAFGRSTTKRDVDMLMRALVKLTR